MSHTTDHSPATPAQTVHSTAACRSSRHTRVQHLIAADESSLAELEVLLATLPLCSTGRVFIEVPDASWFSDGGHADLHVPGRMVVTWLDRAARTGAPGSSRACAPGQALARAVNAWSDEMLCADDDHTRVLLLGGYLGTADIVDHLLSRGVDAGTIHTPAPYGLATAR